VSPRTALDPGAGAGQVAVRTAGPVPEGSSMPDLGDGGGGATVGRFALPGGLAACPHPRQ